MQRLIKEREFLPELTFTFERSQGPGGQHVNKVNTQVMLTFSIADSQLLTDEEKVMLISRLAPQINSQGLLRLRCQKHRSQLANKRCVIEKFLNLLHESTRKAKKRIPTKMSKAAKERRMKEKKRRTETKAGRAKIDPRQFL